MRNVIFCAIFALPSMAAAQDVSSYTTEQLVEFYVDSINLGRPRGICIGTAEECADPVVEEPKGLDMMVTFELDSSELTPTAEQNLAVFADMMRDPRLEVASFVVEGHTDARGSDEYNLDLSGQRAQSVTDYLIELGVSPERLRSAGFGKTQPRVEDAMDPENRRVEMRIDLN